MSWRIALLALCLCFSLPAQALPSFAEVRTAYQPSDAWLLARDGQPVQQLRLDYGVRRLQWTHLEDISPALQQALLYSEDRRFYQHAGVDWRAVAAAGWRNLWNSRTRGASTLTMQLAGLLEDGAVGRAGRRGVLEKAGQTVTALRLEQGWRKDEILEAYLNLVGFRGELQGIAAMSFGLFGKAPAALDVRDAALAAALLRAPNASPARVAQRACDLLRNMAAADQCADLEGYASLKLRAPYTIAGADLAPHLARRLLDKPGQQVRSTLDAGLQRYAKEQLRANLLQLENRNVQDGAVLVLDNATGEVLAWVGSSGSLSQAPEVDGVLAQRQAGSTLKPFLYGIAIERRQLTAASILDDSPLRIATPNGFYVPQNYDKHFVGPVSLRTALGSSLNVPAVRTLRRVGPDTFQQRLRALGFETLTESGDYYGYSLALGSADVRLHDLANAYRALANGGQWRSLQALAGQKTLKARQVYTPQATAIVADILADRSARHHTFGLDSALATRYWTAVKTGTSKDMRDNWCVGFSRRYTVGVWVGNAGGQPMHDVSGVSGAAPVWLALMDYLHRSQDGLRVRSDAPPLPAGVEARRIRYQPALEPPRRELFLAGSGQDVIVASQATRQRLGMRDTPPDGALARIAYPGQGSIIALDPEIPPSRQRVPFKADTALASGWHWMLDGRPVQAAWFPQPGRHVLELRDARGRMADSVQFTVRGAWLASAAPGGRQAPSTIPKPAALQ